MISQGGRTTQRVVPLSRLGESSDFLDSLSRASPSRDHLLHAPQPLDRLQADEANLRSGLLFLPRTGQRNGTRETNLIRTPVTIGR